jgi:hypothetical protein
MKATAKTLPLLQTPFREQLYDQKLNKEQGMSLSRHAPMQSGISQPNRSSFHYEASLVSAYPKFNLWLRKTAQVCSRLLLNPEL